MKTQSFKIDLAIQGERLDKFLAGQISESRSRLLQLLKDGHVTVNNEVVKPSYRLKENDEIIVNIPETQALDLVPEDIKLDIVYEDDDLLVINKPQGMVVHPSPGHHQGTLVHALLAHCHDLSGINGVERPGIVHRIDKDTSGLLVVCKNDFTHRAIAEQLSDKTMHREYYALAKGVIYEDDGKIIAPLGRDPYDRLKRAVDIQKGKEAITTFHVIKRYHQYTFLSLRLWSGRTHQIRVHLNYIDHPIEGDPLYGNRKHLLYDKGQLLHAYRLTFVHPRTEKEMSFEVPLPAAFQAVLDQLDHQEN